ncbi:MAG TPA: DEAD/DEAH box helicase [Polyangiaceae bacterium]|nr:DEAD/DEAH box helicase [Polyangiaceae bacterium]
MATVDFAELLGPALGAAISEKGFTELTPVQKAVLDPALAGRDLRVTSQTGSGKTVAIGLVIRQLAGEPSQNKDKLAHPRALVIVPTRELAKQVVQELTWLYAPLDAKVVSVTGGAVYRDEHRALAAGPTVVVGTPGRLLDHLNRGSIDASEVAAVVLDEADRMLDLGFREELEAILDKTPEQRETHLVSATFPREVEALANRVQRDPARVEATRLGVANVDIEHIMHVLEPRQRLDALINLLLANPEAQTLVFARTRADVGDVAERLSENGFAVTALSGEMEQRERDRALNSFRRADHRILVATDVAARGIDVQDITLVIHLDPPTDPDSYTHRSGRTGRAGRKGRSVLLVAPSAVAKTTMLLKRVKVVARSEPVPSAEQIRSSTDQRFFELLTREAEAEESVSARQQALAERLAAREDSARSISRLLAMARFAGPTEPREIRRLERAPDRKAPREREQRGAVPRPGQRERGEYPVRGRSEATRTANPPRTGEREEGWVPFRISWGGDHGADARKLLAMACRWGEIRGSDVGAIDIEADYSRLSVKASVAAGFAEATSKPDSRNPRVTIQLDRSNHGFAPRTMRPPSEPFKGREPREPREARESKPRSAEAEAESVPRQPERSSHKKHPARPREAAHAPREGGARTGREAAHAPREGAGRGREAAHAPREGVARAGREAAPAPRPGAGFPRDASRPRAAKGYPRDAKQHPRDGARPHAGARLNTRTADAPPRDGGQPPRRRRVVTR